MKYQNGHSVKYYPQLRVSRTMSGTFVGQLYVKLEIVGSIWNYDHSNILKS